jgi:hypothetical protein
MPKDASSASNPGIFETVLLIGAIVHLDHYREAGRIRPELAYRVSFDAANGGNKAILRKLSANWLKKKRLIGGGGGSRTNHCVDST